MLMSTPSQPPGRISQVLPSVKCSNCNRPVPLAELGDHICAPAPPLPKPSLSLPKPSLNLPKPTLSPGAATSLLPQRLQGLVAAPTSPRPPVSPRSSTSSIDTLRNDRPRLNTTAAPALASSSYPTRSSPLSRTGDGPPPPRSNSRDPYASGPDSPVRSRPPAAGYPRARSGSNASSLASPSTARPIFASARDIPPVAPPQPVEPALNTQIGGEAGMAGVGRRGFAAAARAAMFASSPSVPPPARAIPPHHLDIGAATSATPPPLSASTGSSNSPGLAPFPESPVSPQPDRRRSRSPPASRSAPIALQLSGLVSSRASSKPSHEPNSLSQSSGSEYGLAYADSTDYEVDDDDDDADLRRANELRSGVGPLKTKNPPPPLPLTATSSSRPSAPSSSILRSDPANTARSTRETNERPGARTPLKHSGSKTSLSSGSESDYGGAASLKRNNSAVIAQAFGLSQTPPNAYGRLGGPGLTQSSRSGHSRSGSSRSAQSAYSSKSAVVVSDATPTPSSGPSDKGRLERQMESMAEDAGRSELSKSKSTGKQRSFSPAGSTSSATRARGKGLALDLDESGGTKSRRSNTVQGPHSPESRTPKLPTRSRTSPTTERYAGRDDTKREKVARKPKICLRCETTITDGRWVQVDGGGVLCERCWKNMYLPKCRRCNLPIEKQAVSSSDGQLKGKYHRECFNCHTCHKPFPDKTFYVLDSKPLCAYHYHEANDSLCAAARCGQPIEGPCAVSHAGDRYHPEHMLCEFPGYGGCKEKLEEYWEVDGRMLCERHSRASRQDEDEDGKWAPSSRAMKRVTRYIDLAGGR